MFDEYEIERDKNFLEKRLDALNQASHLICSTCSMKYYPGGCACNLDYEITQLIRKISCELWDLEHKDNK